MDRPISTVGTLGTRTSRSYRDVAAGDAACLKHGKASLKEEHNHAKGQQEEGVDAVARDGAIGQGAVEAWHCAWWVSVNLDQRVVPLKRGDTEEEEKGELARC